MPLQRVVERDALTGQPLPAIDQPPQVELGAFQLRRRQRVEAFAQRRSGDRVGRTRQLTTEQGDLLTPCRRDRAAQTRRGRPRPAPHRTAARAAFRPRRLAHARTSISTRGRDASGPHASSRRGASRSWCSDSHKLRFAAGDSPVSAPSGAKTGELRVRQCTGSNRATHRPRPGPQSARADDRRARRVSGRDRRNASPSTRTAMHRDETTRAALKRRALGLRCSS